jgi:hypothetical protein
LRKNCLLQHVIEGKIEGKIEVKERRERRCEELLDKVKESRGYWKLKRKHLISLCGELTLEEVIVLP